MYGSMHMHNNITTNLDKHISIYVGINDDCNINTYNINYVIFI